MKRLGNIITAILLLAVSLGCTKDDSMRSKLVGTWGIAEILTRVNGEYIDIRDNVTMVPIFKSDGTFEQYNIPQNNARIENGVLFIKKYDTLTTGTWTLSDDNKLYLDARSSDGYGGYWPDNTAGTMTVISKNLIEFFDGYWKTWRFEKVKKIVFE